MAAVEPAIGLAWTLLLPLLLWLLGLVVLHWVIRLACGTACATRSGPGPRPG